MGKALTGDCGRLTPPRGYLVTALLYPAGLPFGASASEDVRHAC